ncbi:MAG TPA: hypothetical protein VGI03_11535 [Verrucomicrobiae bacterium]
MKTAIGNLLIGLGLLTANLIYAQETASPQSGPDLTASNIDWATAADWQVALQAIEQVPPMPAIDATNGNTFWSAQHMLGSAEPWPPLPGNIWHLPGWDLSDGQYLLDDVNFNYNALRRHTAVSQPVINADGTISIISADEPAPPGGVGGDYSPGFSGATPIDTNLLWLQITNVADATASLNLYNATDYVYAIWSTTNLSMPFTNWEVETEIFRSNTNCLPFTVQTQDRQDLFLQAEDWTRVTQNGNTAPDWWFWEYFGATDLSDTAPDSQGNTLLYDYEHHQDPNVINFVLEFTNDYVNASPIYGSINLEGGEPFYEAVLVNDTNTTDAIWEPYTSTNLMVNLGLTNGIYTVRVGLRGLPSNATESWGQAQITLNGTPLTLGITSPSNSTVSTPMIQVQGYASGELTSLSYDVSNATGLFTNQTGYVTGEFYDTNLMEFTANYFQCYDVILTNGLNTITVYATDVLGQVATTNLNVTLDYSDATNPPALSIIWPQSGSFIGGNSFTLQAQVDDDTATVTASIDGQTRAGLVERSGKVWVNNLPMSTGTNILTVTATDAAGNSTTTNLTLVQSSALVTMDPLSTNELNQSLVNVAGTISDTNETYDIFVNGIGAYYLDGQGDWEADNVPVSPTGTATFDVEIYFGYPTNTGSQIFTVIQPPLLILSKYEQNSEISAPDGEDLSIIQWDYAASGSWNWNDYGESGRNDASSAMMADTTNYIVPEVTITNWGTGYSYSGTFSPTWHEAQLVFDFVGNTVRESIQTTPAIVPGGQAQVGATSVYLVTANAMTFSDPWDDDNDIWLPAMQPQDQPDVPVPPEQLSVNGYVLANSGITNADGSISGFTLVSVPAGTSVPLHLTTTNSDVTFNLQAYNFQLTVVSNSATQIDRTNWAVVKTLTNNYVTVQATVENAGNNLLTNLANVIQWTGGESVPGNPMQRRITTTNSVETTITASLDSITNSLNVWVIWATINIQTSGTNPAKAPSFANANVAPGYPFVNQLGVQYYDYSSYAAGQICAVANITPSGVHSIITNGWDVFQMRVSHDFKDGSPNPMYYDTMWQSDGPGSDFKTVIPDLSDNLYTIDGPNIGPFASDSYETYNNFYDYITWNSTICCSTNNFWYFEGRWKSSQTPPVTFTGLGTGTNNLPTNSFYPPP